MPNTLRKPERLHYDKVIGRMFQDASGSFTVFPLRVVYLKDRSLGVPSSILVSVSKRRFKHAVDRNRIKRQIRESFRLEKDDLNAFLEAHDERLAIAFVYLSSEHTDTELIHRSVRSSIKRLKAQLDKAQEAE